MEVIGLVPAAGLANRISPIPCSKEIFPLGWGQSTTLDEFRPTVAGSVLLKKLLNAGVKKAFFIIRKGKWDIPQYFGNGSMIGMDLAYLIMGEPYGVPFTLNQAFPFIGNKMVAFGFPDILYPEEHPYLQLLECQASSGADLLLGLFPVGNRLIADRVNRESNGEIRGISTASTQLDLGHTWGIAVWTPFFSQFLHELIDKVRGGAPSRQEWSMSEVINEAIQSGLKVQGIHVSSKPFLDIGTPEGLAQALRQYGADTQ